MVRTNGLRTNEDNMKVSVYRLLIEVLSWVNHEYKTTETTDTGFKGTYVQCSAYRHRLPALGRNERYVFDQLS